MILGEGAMASTMTDAITVALHRALQAHESVDLLNVYKGMPVVYSATIRAISEAGVQLQTTGYEAVSLVLDGHTTLLTRQLDQALRARLLRADLAHNLITLEQLEFAGSHVGDRMMVRVAPREPIEVKFDCGGQSFSGVVSDLSINGLGVQLPAHAATSVRPRMPAEMAFYLPHPGATTLYLKGTVRFVRPGGEHDQVGLMFSPDTSSQALLRYVRGRQDELLAELKAQYDARVAAATQ
jgi:hypothetical protein